jgi:hypothetical protein
LQKQIVLNVILQFYLKKNYMATHRFPVHVPNPAANAASVMLTLKAVSKAEIKKLRLDTSLSPLKVTGSFISMDACAEKGVKELAVKLKPYSSMDVYVTIQTAPSKRPGSVFYNLIDRRGPKTVGGVLLVCQEPSMPAYGGVVVNTKNPCPVVLASDIYITEEDGDLSKPMAKNKIPFNTVVEIVAPVTNPTSQPLHDVVVYLEHLGISGLEFEAGVWNVGTLEPGDIFYAAWKTKLTSRQHTMLQASVVAGSHRKEPVRLKSTFEMSSNNKR